MSSLPGQPQFSDDPPLDDLLRRAFDEELSDDEFAALQGLLDSSAEDRRKYLEYASAHVLLLQSFEAANPAPTASQVVGMAQSESATPRKRNRRRIATLAAVIAASVAVIVWSAVRSRNELQGGPSAVAWINRKTGAQSSKGIRPGGRVRTTDGRIDVRFENGVELALSDGGELEILSATKVRLHTGNIQVDVGESGRGFTVLTRSTDVVDLGTVFGVGVSSTGDTDVVVFEGEVELGGVQKRSSRSASDRSLVTGEAVRVKSDGHLSRLPMIWRDSKDSQWSAAATTDETSVIESVRDNLSTAERPKFYAVVPQGFREDAKVYADRNYEWNSLDKKGLPPELVGADYIRTFNSDKAQSDLEIVVRLNDAATVFVLLDKRFPAPDWLSASFVKMDYELGIDLGNAYEKGVQEVPPLGISVKRVLGKGPGELVDVPVTVWKREISEAGDIRFGPVPAETLPPGRGSMYGILAIPTKRSL